MTVRLGPDLLNLFRDGQGIGTITESDVRDMIETTEIQRGIFVNVKDAPYKNQVGSYAQIQSALDAVGTAGKGTVLIPNDFYDLTDAAGDLLPSSNTEIIVQSGARIRQTIAGKGGIKVVQKDNVHIKFFNSQLYGPGVWSNLWNGIDGHDERGLQFWGCTNCSADAAFIRNWGLSGIVILGGRNIRLKAPTIEGTHALGSVLAQGNSFQFPILIIHDTIYGACADIRVNDATYYNTAMGLNTAENIPNSYGLITISATHAYDIIGQHGAYIGTSHTNLSKFKAQRCGLDGIKFFSGANNEQLTNMEADDFDVSDCPNGQAIEFGVSGTGFITTSHATGKSRNCARGGTFDGDVRNSYSKVISRDSLQRAFYVSGAIGPKGCKWEVDSDGSVETGVTIASATSADNILIPKIRHPSTGGGGFSAVDNAASASLEIRDLNAFDDAGKMARGFINSNAAANTKLTGEVTVKGYVNNGISGLAGSLEWHGSSVGEFSTPNTAFFDSGDKVVPITPMGVQQQSVSAANINLWKLTLDDNTRIKVTVTLEAKQAGASGNIGGSFKTTATFFRNAGGAAAQEGVEYDASSRISAGFPGVYTWGVTGNACRLLVNSGGATNVNWKAKVVVEKLTG